MKEKVHYLIEAILSIAVIVLFVLFFTGKNPSSTVLIPSVDKDANVEGRLPVAYIDIDSLMQNYTYSIDLNEQIAKKFENSRANITERLRKLQTEASDFQRKVETGSFLSRERAEAEQQRILKKQEDLQKLEAQLSQELSEDQLRMTQDLSKTIITQLKEYNKDKGYHIVYGRINDNIMLANEEYNITGEVIDYLNKRHASSPLVKPAE
jgi:outer membrane protein